MPSPRRSPSTRPRDAPAAGRPIEAVPGLLDRLALRLGVELLLWGTRHAERARHAALAHEARLRTDRATRQVFVERHWIGPR